MSNGDSNGDRANEALVHKQTQDDAAKKAAQEAQRPIEPIFRPEWSKPLW